jgi:flavin-binding protein dodecin
MESVMVGSSVYNVIELVGASSVGFEEAVRNAVETASGGLTNLRIAEVVKMDVKLDDNRVVMYRARVRLSFKHEVEPETL